MNNKRILEALCMDLKRVALAYHRGSTAMAKRFSEEALKRINEIDLDSIDDYFKRVLKKIPKSLSQSDTLKVSEDALMYSTLVQNYCIKNVQ